ncbi:MAG: DHA2 family efflux MFS transporter permease subunit [Sedimentisphaerales bacterium]
MSGGTERIPHPHEDWLPHNPWVVAGAVILAPFMEVLDTSIANVALPHIAGNLSATIDESTWVLTSYLVSNAIVLPLAGWFSSLIGRKRFYIGCVILFTVTSFLCGLAPGIGSLVVFRILQGAGGGALQPIAQSILIESFPHNKRGMAMAMFGMCVVTAPIIGPTLGGWITDNYTWRWVFFINIPVGILAVFLATILIKDPPYFIRKKIGEGFRIDYIGLGLIAVGLGALQIVLDKGEREDWFDSHFIVSFSLICAVCLALAVIWELRQKDPVIKLGLLKDRNFAVGVFMMYALGFSLYGSTVLLPIFLQNLMGYNALTSGLALSPGGIITMLTMPLVGFLMTRVQARWLIIIGLIVGAVGLFRMVNFNLQISYSDAVWSRNILSAGLGFLFVPINTSAYYYIVKTETDYASGLINLARNLGGSTGISFVTTMLARRAQFHQNILVSHVTETNPIYQSMLQNATNMLVHQGANAVEAATKAKALIYGMVKQQASMLAFIDNFWVLGVVFLVMIPLVFLMKKTTPRKAAVSLH